MDKELEKECETLPGFDPGWQPNDWQETLEDNFKKIQEERDHIILYDPVKKKKRSYGECNEEYGKHFANKMLHAKKNNEQLDMGDFADLMKEFGSKTNKKSGNKINGHFTPLLHLWMDNEKIWTKISSYFGIYSYLLRHITRKKLRKDKFNTYENYYKKGYLAFAMPSGKLGKNNGMSKNKAVRHIKKLEDAGAIKIDKIKGGMGYNEKTGIWYRKYHNIYILGKHEKGKETLYIERVE